VSHVRDETLPAGYLCDRPPGRGADPVRPGRSQLCELYRTMLVARFVDEVEAEMTAAGEANFHVSGAGHEGSAVLQLSLTPADWLHLHYRDKALMLARGVPPVMFFHSALCNAASHSAGRQMSAHLSDPGRRVLSLVGPVGNNALQAVGVAAAVKSDPERPVVVCSMGDGTTQQGEVMEAVAEAVRSELPVLFWVEDNAYAISTRTASRTFYSLPDWCGGTETFHGLPIHRLDGRDPAACAGQAASIVEAVRRTRRPAIAVFEVDRLSDHTNADDERVYRPREEIHRVRRQGDPIQSLGEYLVRTGVSRQELERTAGEASAEVRRAADEARRVADPEAALDAKKPLPAALTDPGAEYRGHDGERRVTMLEAIREVLRARMAADGRVTLLGEDIEDPKGDVFGITRGLTLAFPGRVANSALTESTVVGVAVGRALAGGRPVAFIQFADFLPLAFNQILSELGSMHWRTAGGWDCPVVVMAPCGGYRPGLGPFHAQTLESVMAHVPGVDVFMPSSAADAAGLLNAAFESGRPTVYLYPKVCLNDRDATTSDDVARQLVPPGKARHLRRGDDLTVVAWGSTVKLCEQAAAHLGEAGVGVDLIDLRSIAPWDREAVCGSARRTGRVIVVHEDNATCGFGAEVLAAVAEGAGRQVACRRVTRPDTYVPCNYPNQLRVLPSVRRVLEAAAEMLDLELTWESAASGRADVVAIEAIGASPADQYLTVVDWLIAPGDEVRVGQRVAEADSDKSVFEVASPHAGTVESILVAPGEPVRVGTPLALLRVRGDGAPRRGPARDEPGTPRLRRRPGSQAARATEAVAPRRTDEVGMSRVYPATGSVDFRNTDVVRAFPKRTPEEILRRFGIERRHRIAAGESVLTMAVAAARQALEREGLSVHDLGLIVCSTNTPTVVVPSLACLLLNELSAPGGRGDTAAFDVTAGCTGYLYALASGYDYLQSRPSGRVLVVTAEAMSTITDPRDIYAATHYSDAASATVLYGPGLGEGAGHWARLRRPWLGAKGEDGSVLRVDLTAGGGRVSMDGKSALAEALPWMAEALARACAEANVRPAELDLVIPHQGSATQVDRFGTGLNLSREKIYRNFKERGNSSSSSIPVCLAEVAERGDFAGSIGLSAFGGGFTFGAAIVIRRPGPGADEPNRG
jgi:2-oxoisovalerate dehydrogenase E1 component